MNDTVLEWKCLIYTTRRSLKCMCALCSVGGWPTERAEHDARQIKWNSKGSTTEGTNEEEQKNHSQQTYSRQILWWDFLFFVWTRVSKARQNTHREREKKRNRFESQHNTNEKRFELAASIAHHLFHFRPVFFVSLSSHTHTQWLRVETPRYYH